MTDVGANYYQGQGGYYSQVDHSGPYSISPAGVLTLLGTASLAPTTSFALVPVTGTLAKAGDSVVCSAPGACDYLIQISGASLVGTFATSDPTTGGSRRLYKTGVGPLEISSETLDGTQPASLEYRCKGGGDGLRVLLTNFVSGSATVKIWASYVPNMIFQNGPAHTTKEAAVRGGRGFKHSFAAAVAAGNVLNYILSNPAGSGRNLFLDFRRFQQTSANVLQFQQFINPTQLTTGATTLAIANRRNDSTMTPVAVAKMIMGTAALATGTAGPVGYITTNGVSDATDLLDMIAPGTSIGYSFTGVGGTAFTGTAANIAAAFTHTEEGIV